MVDLSSLVNYVVIQLYSYIGTRHVFKLVDKRRSHRLKKQNRDATQLENFFSLLFSFIIGGVVYLAINQYLPLVVSIGPSVLLGYLVLLILGFFLARKWKMLKNPYA